jgi:uncharacterized SAM-binding protein YcdF (DUF218 family)
MITYFCLTVISALSFLMIGFLLFVHQVASMKTPPEVDKHDAILVLTGGQNRLEKGLNLLARQKGLKLLVSGVHISASKMKLLNNFKAVTPVLNCCVDIGYLAKNTVGNAVETSIWMDQNGFKSALLVTNNYHMMRAILEINRVNSKLKITPYPVVNSDLTQGKWMLRFETSRVLFIEYVKFLGANGRKWLM